MKPENQEKMIKYISKPHTDVKMVNDMHLTNDDLDEMILRLGRKCSFLKAIRGPIEPLNVKSQPKWNGGTKCP